MWSHRQNASAHDPCAERYTSRRLYSWASGTSGWIYAVSPFYDRPYLVIHADRFASAIGGAIADPEVRSIGFAAGSVDQFVDSTDVLTNPIAYRRLRTLYE